MTKKDIRNSLEKVWKRMDLWPEENKNFTGIIPKDIVHKREELLRKHGFLCYLYDNWDWMKPMFQYYPVEEIDRWFDTEYKF